MWKRDEMGVRNEWAPVVRVSAKRAAARERVTRI